MFYKIYIKMKKITLSCLFLLVVFSADLRACGYSFVGGCSSMIHLKINGTEGIFAIDSCNADPLFQGLQLGNLRNLNLSGASVITWESCTNNVTDAAI